MADTAVPDFGERLAAFQSATFQSATFAELRPGQQEVLAAYAQHQHHLDAADLAIEMPTGEGKTLLALLIANYATDQGWSVAYLTGTRQLAERVQDEAAKRRGPARTLYRAICDLVVAHTDAYPGLPAMRDGTAQPGTPPELLSFSDWAAIAAAAWDEIEASPLVSDDKFAKYEADEIKKLNEEADDVKAEGKARRDEAKKLKDEIKWVWPRSVSTSPAVAY